MLVLSRRKDEVIKIGDDIEISIIDIKGDTVRIGISAPKEVAVHRKEVYDAIRAENMVAATQSANVFASLGKALTSGQVPNSTAGSLSAVTVKLPNIGVSKPKSDE